MADAEFRYADLLPAADDTPYRLDLVAQGVQVPAADNPVRVVLGDHEDPFYGKTLSA